MNNLELLSKAKDAYQNAYAPYSNFRVGASVLFEDGTIYQGCNVENASYGLSLCAERNAISTAIAAGQKGKILKIAIACETTKMCSPCGACRQWIYEFNDGQDIEVILESEDGAPSVHTITELLPLGFKL